MFYLGPIDGHDVNSLVKILKNLKEGPSHGPVLLHVVTEKGKGHPFSKKRSDMHTINHVSVGVLSVKKFDRDQSVLKS